MNVQRGVNAASMLATELRLLQAIEHKFELLLWESTPTLVLSTQDARLPNVDSARRHLASKGWQTATRKTGGTAFPQGPGIINLSLLVNAGAREQPNNIDADYELFCSLCQNALQSIGIETSTGSVSASFCDGRFNINANGRKLAGTSQRWSRGDKGTRKLFHCGLLFDTDLIELCEQINSFYSIARDQSDRSVLVQAPKHTSVREQNPELCLADFISALEISLDDFISRVD